MRAWRWRVASWVEAAAGVLYRLAYRIEPKDQESPGPVILHLTAWQDVKLTLDAGGVSRWGLPDTGGHP